MSEAENHLAVSEAKIKKEGPHEAALRMQLQSTHRDDYWRQLVGRYFGSTVVAALDVDVQVQ